MLSYEEAGLVLDELVDELPEGIFENLNGGVSFVEEAVTAEDGRYTLGTYFRNGMGRYIELYYGSFVELYGEMDDELFCRQLERLERAGTEESPDIRGLVAQMVPTYKRPEKV